MLNIGIDIGGTKIAGGVVSADGTIVDRIRVDTPADTDALADAVADMVRHFRASHDVTAVGVAAAGFLDRTRSIMRHAPNIDWVEHPLRAELEARVGVAVVLENDANAAGWAEYRFGAGRGSSNMVMLTLGTGVGERSSSTGSSSSAVEERRASSATCGSSAAGACAGAA